MKKMAFQKLWDRFNLSQSNHNKAKGGVCNRIHSVEEFRLLLERERVRTERTGVKFSLVIFGIGNQKNPLISIEGLANVLTHRVRLTDEVGWFDEQEYGVLLINTSTEGAWKFVQDILQGVPNAALIRSFKVYTYPTQWQTDRRDDSKNFQHPDLPRHLDRAAFQGSFQNPLFPPDRNGESIRLKLYNSSHPPLRTMDGMEKFLVRRLPRWKRLMDIVGSTIGLLLFSPLMFVVAASIKLTSPGPILFKQERVGFLEGRFTLLKFRTMYSSNNPDIHKKYVENFIKRRVPMGEQTDPSRIYKINNDPRVTFVGKLLRKTSLDELPQFINVLKGEMSLVGPRPPIPYEYEHYDIWHMRRAWEVKPGITGLWQIKGRSKTTFDQMARLDLKYLKEWSLWLDLKILIQTPWAVFTAKGAY
jgi:lipopolysaccharide/colanic/teichoic acid biosynthesis glycosyltransferase